MDFQYNQGVSSDFADMQAGFDAIEREKAGVSTGKSETSSANSSFRSNKLRGVIFDTVANAMQPEKKYIAQYEELIRSSYVKRAKHELEMEAKKSSRGYVTRTNRPTYTGRGWARGASKGGLYHHFNADVNVKITKLKKGTMEIKFEVRPNFDLTPWGVGLAEERSPESVQLRSISGWIKQKIKNGTFRITKQKIKGIRKAGREKDKINKSIDKLTLGVAIAIQKTIAKSSKPPVLKDWYKLDKNKRLELGFRQDVDKKGAYYRSQIRKSIIRNINAQK